MKRKSFNGNTKQLKWLLLALIGLGAAVAAGSLLLTRKAAENRPVVVNGTAVPPVPVLDPGRITQGEQHYLQYCASCHGANLEGASNWKTPLEDGSLPPPPHDSSGHTWHHPDELLLQIILEGGEKLYDGTMPAFEDRLTHDQSEMILDFIKSRWGKDEREYQWWMTAASD